MGFCNAVMKDGKLLGGFITVWGIVKNEEKYTSAWCTSSRKASGSNEYKTDWSGVVTFIGEANKKIKGMGINPYAKGSTENVPHGIRVRNGEVTSNYDRNKKTTYINYTVYEFDDASKDSKGSGIPDEVKDKILSIPEDTDDGDLPFN